MDTLKEVDKLILLEYKSAVKENYPPNNYVMLREALDFYLEIIEEELKRRNNG